MTGPLQVLLTTGPLAFYFYVLAIWQGGRHPRVVSGRVDAALLAFGVGGLLTFGPFGHLVMTMLFGMPTPLQWLELTLLMVLVGFTWVRWSAQRLVVYHVDPQILDQALMDLLDLRQGHHVRTLDGFEDRSRKVGLKVQIVPPMGTAMIEAIGPDPEQRIGQLHRQLQERLAQAPTPSSAVASLLYGMSALTMLASMAGMFLTQPRARAALRGLLERLQGG
jgi:hypothetical protein